MVKISPKRQLVKLLDKCYWEYNFDHTFQPFKIVYEGMPVEYYDPGKRSGTFFTSMTLPEQFRKVVGKIGWEKSRKTFNNYFGLQIFDL